MADRREQLEAAFALHEEGNNDGAAGGQEDLTPDPSLAGQTGGEGDAGADQGTDLDAGAGESAPAAGKARDPAGRFAKADQKPQGGEQVPPAAKPAEKGALKPEGQQPAAPDVKAPQSWKPAAREAFAKAPKEVQEEVTRREQQIDATLRQTADMRNYAQSISRELAPYDAMIKAEGGNHVTAVQSLMRSAYILRAGDPQTKARMVAEMIVKHQVDPEMLDQAYMAIRGGTAPQGGQGGQPAPQMASWLQEQLRPIQQFIGTLQQRQQSFEQQSQQSMEQELNTFASDPANKYFNDVAPIMADILDTAAKFGQKITLQDAYRRATLAHPEIAPLVAREQVSASAAQRSAAARRALNASASLPSGGAPSGAAEQVIPGDRRSAIEAAWNAVESRGS